MSDTERQQEQSPKRPGRKESAGVTAIANPGRRQSQGIAAMSLAPPGRKAKPASNSTLDTSNASQDDGNVSLPVPTRLVDNPFGVEDIANKIICEGTLGLNLLTKRYFVLYGSGTVYLYKSEAQKEKSNTAEELTDRLLTITPCQSRKLKGHWVTFHFDNGRSRNYKTAGEDNQQQWINAGNLIKA